MADAAGYDFTKVEFKEFELHGGPHDGKTASVPLDTISGRPPIAMTVGTEQDYYEYRDDGSTYFWVDPQPPVESGDN
jgi:hypothetical protein